MKKLFSSLAFVFLFHGFSIAQFEDTFIDAFLPESSYYQGHCNNSGYQLDTLDWSEWYNSGRYHSLCHYRYVFNYLPDGHVQQIRLYALANNQWRLAGQYSFEYDENGRLTTYRKTQGGQYYTIQEYTYDTLNRVSVIYVTNWVGTGDSHKEYQYEYDEAGHLTSQAIYWPDQGRYFSRFLYEYENDKMSSECYQRWIPSTEWNNVFLIHFSYEEDKVSEMLYQNWNSSEGDWYNYEKQVYEYFPDEGKAFIISQSWDDEWVNQYRATNFISHGRLIIESTQKWQDGGWTDFTMCDYSFDDAGNFTSANWKDYVDGEWINSDYNTKTIISYNEGGSILCDYIQSFEAKYSSTDKIDESICANHFSIYPNPGTTHFNVLIDVPMEKVEVYDLMGHQMFSQTISGNTIRINTESWPSGVYFWKVISETNNAVFGKWIKE